MSFFVHNFFSSQVKQWDIFHKDLKFSIQIQNGRQKYFFCHISKTAQLKVRIWLYLESY